MNFLLEDVLHRSGPEFQHKQQQTVTHRVQSALPDRALLAGNGAVPLEQVQRAVGVLGRCGDEAERMVASPGFALLGQTLRSQTRHSRLKQKPYFLS